MQVATNYSPVEIESKRVPGTNGIFQVHQAVFFKIKWDGTWDTSFSDYAWSLSHEPTGLKIVGDFLSHTEAMKFGKELWGRLSNRTKRLYEINDPVVAVKATPKRIVAWIRKTRKELSDDCDDE